MRALLRDEAGSSTVEVALVAPVIVAALLWSLYTTELGLVRIRQQEASRFLTWEMTAHGIQDFEGGAHGRRFEEARRKAETETLRRYANLQGHDEGRRSRLLVIDLSLSAGQIEIQSVPATVLAADAGDPFLDNALRGAEWIGPPGGPIRSVFRKAETAHRSLLASQGFNVNHVGAHTRIAATVTNRLLPAGPSMFPERFRRRELAAARAGIEVETWALPDGSDVDLPGEGHPFWKQVDRMVLAGIGNELRAKARGIGWSLDALPVRLSAQLVSQRYGDPDADASRLRCGNNELAATGKWRSGARQGTAEDTMSAAKCFDTLPMEADALGAGYRGDPTYRQLEARGEGDMGRAREGPMRLGRRP